MGSPLGFRRIAGVLGLVAMVSAALLSGCVTREPTDPMATSDHGDIPWNQPQAWEGTLPMPGPMGGGY
ncbi:MAG: hypothetical protein KBA51_04720 [Kiritimatiellae bacterium]|nr:hypothetical protein [Kiritimatiellia bacterium]